MKGILALVGVLLLSINTADARPKKGKVKPPRTCAELFCIDISEGIGRAQTTVRPAPVGHRRLSTKSERFSQVVGGRPPGCPVRFCGCGASIKVFGRIIPSLNLAANWLRFPRTSASPGMVAARRGHVFVLESHVSGDIWLVHDSNSGGRKTRLHHRSIRGYAIVNPRGGNQYASVQ